MAISFIGFEYLCGDLTVDKNCYEKLLRTYTVDDDSDIDDSDDSDNSRDPASSALEAARWS